MMSFRGHAFLFTDIKETKKEIRMANSACIDTIKTLYYFVLDPNMPMNIIKQIFTLKKIKVKFSHNKVIPVI